MRADFFQSFLKLLTDCFILPFRHPGLAGLYAGTVLGVFGMSMISLFVTVDFAGMGMNELLSFLISHTFSANILAMPIGFYLMRCFPAARLFSVFLAGEVMIFAASAVLTPSPVTAALIYTLLMTPFWLLYHASIMHFSSHSNRGNEVAVAHICMTLGTISGSIVAGVLLERGVALASVFHTGLALMIVATALLMFFAYRRKLFAAHDSDRTAHWGKGIWQAICHFPARTGATMAEMFHDVATSALWPAWLKIIGVGGLATGFLMAATVALKLVLSPVVGKFVNLRRGQDSQYGPMIKLVGWAPWLFFIHPLTSLWSSAFFAAGSHIFKIGLESRWYEAKTYSHLAAREILIGTSRIAALLLLAPVLFYAPPQMYVIAGIAATTLVLACGIHLRRRLIASGA